VIRLWWVTALLCLTIWIVGSRTAICPSARTLDSVGVTTCALAAPASDDASDRRWDAPVRTAAYLTQSVWTSPIHHAEVASAPCLEGRLASSARTAPRPRPHGIRPHVRTPLLI
jgi:hypothetical protein